MLLLCSRSTKRSLILSWVVARYGSLKCMSSPTSRVCKGPFPHQSIISERYAEEQPQTLSEYASIIIGWHPLTELQLTKVFKIFLSGNIGTITCCCTLTGNVLVLKLANDYDYDFFKVLLPNYIFGIGKFSFKMKYLSWKKHLLYRVSNIFYSLLTFVRWRCYFTWFLRTIYWILQWYWKQIIFIEPIWFFMIAYR